MEDSDVRLPATKYGNSERVALCFRFYARGLEIGAHLFTGIQLSPSTSLVWSQYEHKYTASNNRPH
jgi:hypothetical protein